MADMDVFEFAAMIEETPIRSRVIEYADRESGALTAVSLKVGGIGGLLFVVIASAFGVAFVNSMITALV